MINIEEKVECKISVAPYSPTLISLPGIVIDCKDRKTPETMADNLAELLVNMEIENIKYEIYENSIRVQGVVLGMNRQEYPINGLIAFYNGPDGLDNISLIVKFIGNTMTCPMTWCLFQEWCDMLFKSTSTCDLLKETSFYIDGRLLKSKQEFTITRNQSDY